MSKLGVYTKFEKQPDGTVILKLQSKDKGKPDWKTVEGVDFSKASDENRYDFLKFYPRQLEEYVSKNQTGNFSMHVEDKHDGGYAHTVREEIEFWAQKDIVML